MHAPKSPALQRHLGSAMASPLELIYEDHGAPHDEAWSAVLDAFGRVEDACSRFRDQSALATYLAAKGPSTAPAVLVEVLAAAYEAYRVTGGRFDPRVRSALEAFGYDQNFAQMVEPDHQVTPLPIVEPWEDPVLDRELCLLRPARASLDLGGIGKGAALELTRFQLRHEPMAGICAAGGDIVVVGDRPPIIPWSIGIEDPIPNSTDFVATIGISEGASMTSSVRVRQWRSGGRPVHHLIDPRTGQPGGGNLASVTVVGPDPVHAEVWSKALFLEGPRHLEEAEARGLAVVSVDREGLVKWSSKMEPLLTWVRHP